MGNFRDARWVKRLLTLLITLSFFTPVGLFPLALGAGEGPTMGQNLFVGKVAPLPALLREEMRGRSWKRGCPVPLGELRVLTLSHWGQRGEVREGRLVAHRDVAQELVDIFRDLFEAGFVVEKLGLASELGGDDGALMEANITSAFNCRPSTGKKGGFSIHSYGRAIDINPKWNPYVRGKLVLPPAGREFVDRTRRVPGSVQAGGPAQSAFHRRGWRWGGKWKSLKDYQHFEKRRSPRGGAGGAVP